MKIYLGTDHAGFELKEHIKEFLLNVMSYNVVDMGAHTYDSADDYPDFILPVAESVARDRGQDIESFAVIFGGTGQGEAMVANRVAGVRCAVYNGGPRDAIILTRSHNNANMLSLGARFLSEDDAEEIVGMWLTTDFSGDERHVRRLGKY